MPLTIQLVYMSAATRTFDPVELTVMLAKARQKNEGLNISGMLVYHDDSFLQVLEGEEQAVTRLYDRIKLDERHARCELLLRTYIDRRNFGGWSMGFVNSQLVGPTSTPGYHDFFAKRFSSTAFLQDASTAHKLLLDFRSGNWRQKVDIGAVPSLVS